jgi:hypothetical protein
VGELRSCRRDPPRLPSLAKVTCISELPTPAGTLKLPSDLLPMPETKSRFERDGLAALLVANLPPDVKKLWLCLAPLQINLLRDTRRKRSFRAAAQGSRAEPITTNRQRRGHGRVTLSQRGCNFRDTMVSTNWE